MSSTLKKRSRETASDLLKKFRKDSAIKRRLIRIKEERRLSILLKNPKYRSIRMLNNLKRNRLLYRLNKIVPLGVCPFFKLHGPDNRQICKPENSGIEISELMLKLDKLGFKLELIKRGFPCTCDLREEDCKIRAKF